MFLHIRRAFALNMTLYSCDSIPMDTDLFHLHAPGEWMIP